MSERRLVNGFIKLQRELVLSERWQAMSPGAQSLQLQLQIWVR